jgi:protein-disulfide isomerase
VKFNLLTGLLLGSLFIGLPCFGFAGSEALSAEQTKQVESVVHRYLVENPQVLVESFQTLKNREAEKRQQGTDAVASKHARELFDAPNSPILGNRQGNVTIVEFLDYRCPHCQTMGLVIDNLIKNDSKLRVVIKELPIFGKESQYAAKAALSAAKQGKFAELHAAFLSNHGSLDESKIKELAQRLGITIKKLETDMQNPSIDKELSNNVELAQSLQIEGTPAFIIRNRVGGKTLFVPGAISQEDLQEMIERTRSGIRS